MKFSRSIDLVLRSFFLVESHKPQATPFSSKTSPMHQREFKLYKSIIQHVFVSFSLAVYFTGCEISGTSLMWLTRYRGSFDASIRRLLTLHMPCAEIRDKYVFWLAHWDKLVSGCLCARCRLYSRWFTQTLYVYISVHPRRSSTPSSFYRLFMIVSRVIRDRCRKSRALRLTLLKSCVKQTANHRFMAFCHIC